MLAWLSEKGTFCIPQIRHEHPHYRPSRLFRLIPGALRGTYPDLRSALSARAELFGNGGRSEGRKVPAGASRRAESAATIRLPRVFLFAFRVSLSVQAGARLKTSTRRFQAWPLGASQLLLRSQGPRGPIAIACPVSTPNQSLRFQDL
jgi:hypothetical protein